MRGRRDAPSAGNMGRRSDTTAPALPTGIYRKYKASTDFFKRWLLSAGLSLGVVTRRSSSDHALDVYARIVHTIASDPMTLTPAQLGLWSRALAACESAITLRDRASLFFPAQPNDSHAHFLTRLKQWLAQLQDAGGPVLEATKKEATEAKPLDFNNYYEVLSLPDGYFDADDAVFATPAAPVAKATTTEAQRKKLFKEAFTEDLNAELACLIMELEELCECVYAAFFDVKLEKSTLLEATAVAQVAIDSATHVIAKLQLKYPAIRKAPDLISLFEAQFSSAAREKLEREMYEKWNQPEAEPKYRYVPGAFLADYLWVGRQLCTFGTHVIPTDPAARFVRGATTMSGGLYDEDTTPHYTAPSSKTLQFMMEQLPLLYNTVTTTRSFIKYATTVGIEVEAASLSMQFFSHFADFFETRVPSIHTAFLSVCWIRSVAALQGNRYLSRTVSLPILYRLDIEKRLRASIDKATSSTRRIDPRLDEAMAGIMRNLHGGHTTVLVRANPLLAGFIQFDAMVEYYRLGVDVTFDKSQFRAICHIYNALRDRQMIDEIPLLEDLCRVYEPAVFTPSREAAKHSSFLRAYFMSSQLTNAEVDAAMRLDVTPSRAIKRSRRRSHIDDLSRMLHLLYERDLSVLPEQATTSWTAMLKAVQQLCAKELMDTRVLSRDMVKLSDDLGDLFKSLCDALHLRDFLSHRVTVEETVAFALLPVVGSLNIDGTRRAGEDADVCSKLGLLGGRDPIADDFHFPRKAAELISRMFAEPGMGEIEATYYTLPATPAWVRHEFQSVHGSADAIKALQPLELFTTLMDTMKTSSGPLDGEALRQLKCGIVVRPQVLKLTNNDELCSLLHHAAAGRARDRRLVEWMIQMGALRCQPKHFWRPPAPDVLAARGASRFCNELAVHSAVKVGDRDIVKQILEAEHCLDVDTVTFHSRESLAHLAVKHGHQHVLMLLGEFDADVTRKDANGKYVYDLTSNPVWRCGIVQLALYQKRKQARPTMQLIPLTSDDVAAKMCNEVVDNLRRGLQGQIEAELSEQKADATPKKKSSKNKKKKEKAPIA